ncbi:uncharacterized protein LOC122536550 [Frieseomelitta varia]|uniref:uncharacterized protein LOC122536550 n=1 Tax=Frieseomelitta varia TaxID=561572 RepID=UPI001CB6AC48|nr:uncharacterized protein LOC122536550 [Frieseomelitta varia]
MIKGSKRFNELMAHAQYFITNEWTFHRDNVRKMMIDVKTLKDSEIVKLNRDVDWKRYIAIYMTGIEKFILKEKFKSIDASDKVATDQLTTRRSMLRRGRGRKTGNVSYVNRIYFLQSLSLESAVCLQNKFSSKDIR